MDDPLQLNSWPWPNIDEVRDSGGSKTCACPHAPDIGDIRVGTQTATIKARRPLFRVAGTPFPSVAISGPVVEDDPFGINAWPWPNVDAAAVTCAAAPTAIVRPVPAPAAVAAAPRAAAPKSTSHVAAGGRSLGTAGMSRWRPPVLPPEHAIAVGHKALPLAAF
jgi:hypothetical protein